GSKSTSSECVLKYPLGTDAPIPNFGHQRDTFQQTKYVEHVLLLDEHTCGNHNGYKCERLNRSSHICFDLNQDAKQYVATKKIQYHARLVNKGVRTWCTDERRCRLEKDV